MMSKCTVWKFYTIIYSILLSIYIPGFSETYILGEQQSEKLGVVCSGIADSDVCTLSQTASTDNTCYIYRLTDKPDVILVQCKGDVAPEQAFSWTQQVALSNFTVVQKRDLVF